MKIEKVYTDRSRKLGFWSNMNFKMSVLMKNWEEDRSRRKKTDEKKGLKRRTSNNNNPFIRQSFGGQPRQLVGVRTLKVGECNTRMKSYQWKCKNILELTPRLCWTKHYWNPWHKNDVGRNIHFYTHDCLQFSQFASLVESESVVSLLLLKLVCLPLLLRLPI